jgi:hypothetical protein
MARSNLAGSASISQAMLKIDWDLFEIGRLYVRFRKPRPKIQVRPKRAALPESRESETCCEAPGRVSAAAVESGIRRTDERFCGTESCRSV